ncbi:MAG: hypothetical protein CMH13_11145 [Martelella sp.]|nr:hypothetical protein [Martelella sp.]|tara:strand:- start:298 stop:594 length:297 start_codon:yes stop_codon:yes gene_type:complete
MRQPDDFVMTDKAKADFPMLSGRVALVSVDLTKALIECGQTPSEAGSIVAHLFLRQAWLIAATCRLADGVTPDPDRFRAATESALAELTFPEAEGSET